MVSAQHINPTGFAAHKIASFLTVRSGPELPVGKQAISAISPTLSGRPRLSVPPLQLSCVAGIDRYAIAIRIDQLEVVVTKELVLSNCIYRQSLFH